MYSVFLVDDESLIREGVKQMVEWSQYGFELVGEAPDGELAWPLIQKCKPDIVLSDIKMPFMDGLELSRLIKKELPHTTIVILSGYDEFAYAKEALSIGVSEYLLKPLSKKQIVDVLCEVKRRKDTEHNKVRERESEMRQYMDAARSSLMDALLNGRQNVSLLLERAKKLDVNLAAENYNVVFVQIGCENDQDEASVQSVEQQNMLCERYPQLENVFLCKVGQDGVAFLIGDMAAQIDSKTEQCIRRAEEICKLLPGTPAYSIEVGGPISRLSQIPECFRKTRGKIFQNQIDASIGKVGSNKLHAADVDFDPNTMNAASFDQRVIEKFLIGGQSDTVSEFITQYFSAIGEGALDSLLFRQYLALHIQFSVNSFLGKLAERGNLPEKFRTDPPSAQELTTLKGTKQYLATLLEHAISLRERAAGSRYSAMLNKSVAYMQEHFDDPELNLNTVAQIANVRPTYFSSLFSQQMGKTFIEYLTELRMERAKAFLRCTDKSSGDIAFEVGYNDPHYFSFLFKKVNGCAPRDYRAGGKSIDEQ